MKKVFRGSAKADLATNAPELIQRIMDKHKIKAADLAELLDVGVMTVRDWHSGKTVPKFPVYCTLSMVYVADILEF